MPERIEIYIVYKRRYINTLPFLSFPYGGWAVMFGDWAEWWSVMFGAWTVSVSALTLWIG